MIGREERMLGWSRQHFSLEDLLDIKARLIGTGYIGGKAVGMLLARKILEDNPDFDWTEVLEKHDSFYIGSDIFHTYIVQNGLWKLRMEQKTPEGYFTKAARSGAGPAQRQVSQRDPRTVQEMIEYSASRRSSSVPAVLLEDSFGNAFAGKYESLFLVNQGSPEDRYEQFEQAVRKIYASTMNEDALTYRLQRGLDQMDEQMALLVQRVSGTHHGHYFFPDAGRRGRLVQHVRVEPVAGSRGGNAPDRDGPGNAGGRPRRG